MNAVPEEVERRSVAVVRASISAWVSDRRMVVREGFAEPDRVTAAVVRDDGSIKRQLGDDP